MEHYRDARRGASTTRRGSGADVRRLSFHPEPPRNRPRDDRAMGRGGWVGDGLSLQQYDQEGIRVAGPLDDRLGVVFTEAGTFECGDSRDERIAVAERG